MYYILLLCISAMAPPASSASATSPPDVHPTLPQNITDGDEELRIVFQLMYDKIKSSDEKVRKANFMKGPHQLSMAYEVGYLIAESRNKYTQMEKLYDRAAKRDYDSLSDLEMIRAYEEIEHLHIDVIHLSNMNHELSKKFRALEMKSPGSRQQQKKAAEFAKQEKAEMERLKKRLAKKGWKFNITTTPKKKYKWPDHDYGWEIDRQFNDPDFPVPVHKKPFWWGK